MKIELKETENLTQKGLEMSATFTLYGDEVFGEEHEIIEEIGEPIPVIQTSQSFYDKDSYDAFVNDMTIKYRRMARHYDATLESQTTEIPLESPEEEESEEEPYVK